MNPWSTRWFEITKKRSYFALWSTFIKWIVLGSVVGILSGTASAFFLKSLDYVTDVRLEHPWLLYLLPLGEYLLVSYICDMARTVLKAITSF